MRRLFIFSCSQISGTSIPNIQFPMTRNFSVIYSALSEADLNSNFRNPPLFFGAIGEIGFQTIKRGEGKAG
jgi:hypothetical protein